MKLVPYLALSLSLLSSVDAQSGRKKDVEVRYVAQAAPKNLGKLVMAAEEGLRSEPFILPLNNLSDRFVVPARAYRLEMEEKTLPLASVTLPAEGNDFIILLVPALKGGFEPIVIANDGVSFRPGDFYVHNVSQATVVGKVGTTDFSVGKRTGRVVRPKGARENRFYDVLIGVRDDEGVRVISSSRWPVQPQMRTYVFFFDDPRRGRVDFRAVDEFVPPKEEE
jgi:hypothetical protein